MEEENIMSDRMFLEEIRATDGILKFLRRKRGGSPERNILRHLNEREGVSYYAGTSGLHFLSRKKFINKKGKKYYLSSQTKKLLIKKKP